MAPTLDPTTISAVTPWAASERSIPTCIEPKLPPPAKTKAVFACPDRVASTPPRNAAKSVMAAPTCDDNCHATPQAKQGRGFQLAVIASHALRHQRARAAATQLDLSTPAAT